MTAVLNKEMGYQKASKQFNVPKTTLIRYIKKLKTANQVSKTLSFICQNVYTNLKLIESGGG